MNKSVEAFRTISEVADELDIPKHVLRFWEVKFPQIKPMKRGGGRRYYRPEDVVLLRGIRNLLHAEGYTIKGVQKILREQGVEEVKLFATAPQKAGRSKKIDRGGRVRPIVGLRRGKGKALAAASAVDVDGLINAAIRELHACRGALVALGGQAGEGLRAAGSGKRQARPR
ncbi:MAG: MerR family transcriptional regulator [Hyphomicrobium aestuarii]|nr:MerR family transcriptional regulator [Hyphomicrobium aestuarii]